MRARGIRGEDGSIPLQSSDARAAPRAAPLSGLRSPSTRKLLPGGPGSHIPRDGDTGPGTQHRRGRSQPRLLTRRHQQEQHGGDQLRGRDHAQVNAAERRADGCQRNLGSSRMQSAAIRGAVSRAARAAEAERRTPQRRATGPRARPRTVRVHRGGPMAAGAPRGVPSAARPRTHALVSRCHAEVCGLATVTGNPT